jgi:hypothetical protein
MENSKIANLPELELSLQERSEMRKCFLPTIATVSHITVLPAACSQGPAKKWTGENRSLAFKH